MIRRELSLNEGVGVEKLETENSNVAVTAYEQAIFDEDRITDDKHTLFEDEDHTARKHNATLSSPVFCQLTH